MSFVKLIFTIVAFLGSVVGGFFVVKQYFPETLSKNTFSLSLFLPFFKQDSSAEPSPHHKGDSSLSTGSDEKKELEKKELEKKELEKKELEKKELEKKELEKKEKAKTPIPSVQTTSSSTPFSSPTDTTPPIKPPKPSVPPATVASSSSDSNMEELEVSDSEYSNLNDTEKKKKGLYQRGSSWFKKILKKLDKS